MRIFSLGLRACTCRCKCILRNNCYSGMVFSICACLRTTYMYRFQFYQEFYGTVLYFWSFFYNRRWEDHGWHGHNANVIFATVVVSNGIWFAGPGLGMYVSYHLLMQGDSALAMVRSI